MRWKWLIRIIFIVWRIFRLNIFIIFTLICWIRKLFMSFIIFTWRICRSDISTILFRRSILSISNILTIFWIIRFFWNIFTTLFIWRFVRHIISILWLIFFINSTLLSIWLVWNIRIICRISDFVWGIFTIRRIWRFFRNIYAY